MLKLKKHVIEFLKANVKPEFLEKCIKRIDDACATHLEDPEVLVIPLLTDETIHGVYVKLGVSECDFEEVEELKPYVWYPREKFDGDPKEYWILEHFDGGCCELYKSPESLDNINQYTTHFMYIEPFGEQE